MKSPDPFIIFFVFLCLGRSRVHGAFGFHGYIRFSTGPPMVLPGLSCLLHLDLALVPIYINVRAIK